ncbi:MAG: hypothetical protein ACT4PV_11740 [Planctomycetaceae bacterium]
MSLPGARRRLRRTLLLGLACLLALVLAAPFATRLAFVRRIVEREVGAALGRPVALASLDAGWFSGIVLRGLRVSNLDGGYAATHLLEAPEVRVESSLLALLFGGGGVELVVRGATVELEESAGGGTNFDDLQSRLLSPAPRPPDAPPAPPLKIELRECRVRMRRPLPRRDLPPIDPFVEDPAVLPAGEGSLLFALEDLEFAGSLGDGPPSLRCTARLLVDGKGGSIRAALRLEKAGLSGELAAAGFDLGALEPLLGSRLAGVAEGSLEGGAGGGIRLSVTIREFVAGAEELGEVREEWVRIAGAARLQTGVLAVDSLEISTASGEMRLQASGSLPVETGGGLLSFHAEGEAPMALLGPALGYEADAGIARFDLRATAEANSIALDGTLRTRGLRLRGRPLDDLDATVRAKLFPRDAKAEVERLVADATSSRAEGSLHADVNGVVAWKGRRGFALRGEARADLAQLLEMARPFLRAPEDAALEGKAALSGLSLVRDEEGALTVRGRLSIEGLLAEGWGTPEVRQDQLLVTVEASLDAAGDTLRVEEGRLDDLLFHGRVAGISDRTFRDAEGALTGSVELSPLLLRALRIAGLSDLRGRLSVDARAAQGPKGVTLEGRAGVSGLSVQGPLLGEAPLTQDALSLAFTLRRENEAWTGSASAEGDAFLLAATDLSYRTPDEATARFELSCGDLAALRAAIPAGLLPADLVMGGDCKVSGRATRRGGLSSVTAAPEAARLTLRLGENGFSDQRLSGLLQAEQTPQGWEAASSNLALPDLGVTAAFGGFTLRGEDVAVTALVLEAPLPSLLALHPLPELARFEPRGGARYEGDCSLASGITLRGRLSLSDLELTVNGRPVASPRAAVEIDAASEPGRILVRRCEFEAAQGKGSLVGEITGAEGARRGVLRFTFLPVVRAFPALLPGWSSEGELRFEGRLSGPLQGESARLALEEGTFRADALRSPDLLVLGAEGTFAGEWILGGVPEPSATVSLHARIEEARYRTLHARGIELDQSSGMRWPAGSAQPPLAAWSTLRAEEVALDALPIEAVRATIQARREEGPWTGTGQMSFKKVRTPSLDWTAGSAQVEFAGDEVTIAELRSKVNGGDVTGSGTLNLATMAWKQEMKIAGVRLDARLGNPLGIIVPVLRLRSGERQERSLEGVARGTLSAAGRGTALDDFRRTLTGSGRVELSKVVARGSLLLPLIGGHFGKALLGAPLEFDTLVVEYEVADGRVTPKPLRIQGRPLALAVRGSTGLDGSLDLVIHIDTPLNIPILRRLEPGVGIRGSFDAPKLRPVLINIDR